MAKFTGAARSNYFKVKDAELFKEWVLSIPSLSIFKGEGKQDGLFAIYSDCPDTGCWPSGCFDEVEIDLAVDLSVHLAEGQIAVLMEAGAERLRYLAGYAVAVNWKGETEYLNLNQIYDLAEKRFGIRPCEASN